MNARLLAGVGSSLTVFYRVCGTGSRGHSIRSVVTKANKGKFMKERKHVGIIGGGFAGIRAAQTILSGGHDCTLFDLGGAPGGRASSRQMRQEPFELFDHGCQFLNPRTSSFKEVVDGWEQLGRVRSWSSREGFVYASQFFSEALKSENGSKTYVANAAGMGGLALSLVQDMDANPGFSWYPRHAVEMIQWNQDGTWTIFSICKQRNAQMKSTYDAVVVADGGRMLSNMNGLPPTILDAMAPLLDIKYNTLYTLMARVRVARNSSRQERNKTLGNRNQGIGSFQFICSNALKLHHRKQDDDTTTQDRAISQNDGIHAQDDVISWVAITSNEKALDMSRMWPVRDSKGTVIPQDEIFRQSAARFLLQELMQAVGLPLSGIEVQYMDSQRWGSAFPSSTIASSCMTFSEHSFAICGDCFVRPMTQNSLPPFGVECAWASGESAGNEILQRLST